MQLPEPETKVRIVTDSGEFEGLVLPSETDKLALKLSSGYNIGIEPSTIKEIKELGKRKISKGELKMPKQNPKLPDITILHTGGTIASKVDYESGAVVSRTTPEEILASVPELAKIVNLNADTVMQMFSEDMETVHWSELSTRVSEEIKKGVKGVIIAMGTDTLEYVASALSFSLRNCPIPIIVLGSQRSSDRPSSDAGMNLKCASHFIAQTDFAGVAVCLHDRLDDTNCLIIEGHHVKKMHTSRRDTFRPVNKRPIARVSKEGKIEYIRKDYTTKEGEFKLEEKFSDAVGLVKIYPGFKAEQLEWYQKNCKGLIIEGYAFGQLPINSLDEHTRHHEKLLEIVKEMALKMPVVIVSQRPYGVVHMAVYTTSRKLVEAGAIEAKMQSHVAYCKLCHVLANGKDFSEEISGETITRSEEDTYLV